MCNNCGFWGGSVITLHNLLVQASTSSPPPSPPLHSLLRSTKLFFFIGNEGQNTKRQRVKSQNRSEARKQIGKILALSFEWICWEKKRKFFLATNETTNSIWFAVFLSLQRRSLTECKNIMRRIHRFLLLQFSLRPCCCFPYYFCALSAYLICSIPDTQRVFRS